MAFSAIVTNPPFGNRGSLAERFIAVGLQQIAEYGFMALLLPADFDSAKTRTRFFASRRGSELANHTTRLVRMILPAKCGQPDPKENNAWFLWSRNVIRGRPPIVLYAPRMPGRDR